MTTPNPRLLAIVTGLLLGGCASTGPTQLFLAGAADEPVTEIDVATGERGVFAGALVPGEQVVGLGYEFNTAYTWLRLAPGDRLIALKLGYAEFWYDYTLPVEFRLAPGQSGDLAVRAFNRMVYVALADGRVAQVERYGEVRAIHELRPEGRAIGGLAWDQRAEQLLVLWADAAEITRYSLDWKEQETITLAAEIAPVSLAYGSNEGRYYVPLADKKTLGVFDREGRLVDRITDLPPVGGLAAGQRSTVRVF